MGGRGQSQGTRAPNEARGPPKEEGGAERVQDTQRTHRPIWGSSGLGMRGTESRGAEEPQGGLGRSREEPGQEVRMSETVAPAEPGGLTKATPEQRASSAAGIF